MDPNAKKLRREMQEFAEELGRRFGQERRTQAAAIEALKAELAEIRAELEAVRKSIPPPALKAVA